MSGGILAAVLLAIVVYQGRWLYPYSIYVTTEVDTVDADTDFDTTFLSINVEMGNKQHADVAATIKREQPDVLFLMETNQVWFDALEEVLKQYKTVVTELKDNYYGCVFATNLPVTNAQIHYVAGGNSPSVHAELTTKAGKDFVFRGLHPRPPVPGNSTKKRDQEFKQTAKYARDHCLPEIVMGDFNDVIWSRSSTKFKTDGQYSDPQVGRWNINSFHARYFFMRLPIDQLYVTKNVQLVEFHRHGYVGSDHYPLIAKLQIR